MSMMRLLLSLTVLAFLVVPPARAQQEVVWVQIEAHPSLRVAQDRARLYAGELADVNGFALGGGWYAIALGPYLRSDAEQVLQVYRAEGEIPRDSFVALSRAFRQQFWPIGANVLNRGVVTPSIVPSEPETPQVSESLPRVLVPLDETPAQARQSERNLTPQQRRDLQIALQAQGYYNSTIDGAFGQGTRRSMAAWQGANGLEETGILTTAQRKALLDQYNAPLLSVGMDRVTDQKAGIALDLPTKAVSFARYEAPFAHYDSIDELGARVLLISQKGDQATLFGLYDILQTLTIVPLDGPRNRSEDSFTLEGRDAKIVSHTEARLENGEIKGFTLIWPVGDEARRARVLSAMQRSFTSLPGTLDPAEGDPDAQNIDLVSGLDVRKPRLSRSGFYIDRSGTVVTTAQAVQNCTRITIDEQYKAQLLTSDDALGVAVLRPETALAPISVARLSTAEPRLQSDVAVSGYSFEGVLGAPTLTFGTLADLKGLRGETELTRLALGSLPGDAGGPVFDAGGSVLGMLLPKQSSSQQLPEDVSFAADALAIREVLEVAGLTTETGNQEGQLDPVDLSRLASGMTVLISCWD